MATVADALLVSMNLDTSGFLKALAAVEKTAGARVKAIAEGMQAPAVADQCRAAATAAGELAKALQDAVNALKEFTFALGGLKGLNESLTALRERVETLDSPGMDILTGVVSGLAASALWEEIGKKALPWLTANPTALAVTAAVVGAVASVAAFLAYAEKNPAVLAGSAWDENAELWNSVKVFSADAWKSVKEVWGQADAWVKNLFAAIKKKAAENWDAIKVFSTGAWEFIKEKWGQAKTWFGDFFDGIKEKAAEIWDAIKDFFTDAWEFVKEKWGQAKDWFESIVDSIKEKFQQLKDFLLELIPDWLKDLLGIDGGKGFEATLTEAKENISKAISDAIPSADDITNGISKAGDAIADFGSEIADSISGFFGFGGSNSSAGVSPALAAGNVDNSTQATFTGPITVQTQATDAGGIAKDFSGAIERRMAATGNKGVQQ